MYRVTSQFKASVQARFASALHHLDDLKREPTWKEEECLFRALGYMKRGNYKLADAELKELTTVFASPGKYPAASTNGREPYSAARLKSGLAELRDGPQAARAGGASR